MSSSASSKPSVVRCTARSRVMATESSGRVGHEHAIRLVRAAPDTPPQLVQLGQPEPVGALDDHHRRGGHVDAHLHHGRAHEHIQLPIPEAAHDRITLGGLEPAVDHAHAEWREQLPQALSLDLGGADPDRPSSRFVRVGDLGPLVIGTLGLDERHDHEAASPQGRLRTDLVPGPLERIRDA